MANEAGYIPMRRGVLEHVERGDLTLTELGAFTLMTLKADRESGIWTGSAKALYALSGAGDISPRRARRVLESLKLKGYIKRFAVERSHCNYPILINQFECTSGAHSNCRLVAENTTDWRNPVYESCAQQLTAHSKAQSNCRLVADKTTDWPSPVYELGAQQSAQQGAQMSPIQEGEGKGQKTMLGKPPTFHGQILEISEREDESLGQAYPWVDRQSCYRQADAWLVSHPERRVKKFAALMRNWMRREKLPNQSSTPPPRALIFGVRQLSPEGATRIAKLNV